MQSERYAVKRNVEKEMKDMLLSCLKSVNDNGITTEVLHDPEAKLQKIKTVTQEDCKLNLHPLFVFEFTNHRQFRAYVDESKVVSVVDIKYCESFYSIMDTQRQVHQLHTTLENRTILDQATSNVLNLEDVISKAARLYDDGSLLLKLSHHRVGIMKKKMDKSYKASQFLTRMKLEKGCYSFLS